MLYMFLLHSEPGTEWPADIIDQHLAFWREAREGGGVRLERGARG